MLSLYRFNNMRILVGYIITCIWLNQKLKKKLYIFFFAKESGIVINYDYDDYTTSIISSIGMFCVFKFQTKEMRKARNLFWKIDEQVWIKIRSNRPRTQTEVWTNQKKKMSPKNLK